MATPSTPRWVPRSAPPRDSSTATAATSEGGQSAADPPLFVRFEPAQSLTRCGEGLPAGAGVLVARPLVGSLGECVDCVRPTPLDLGAHRASPTIIGHHRRSSSGRAAPVSNSRLCAYQSVELHGQNKGRFESDRWVVYTIRPRPAGSSMFAPYRRVYDRDNNTRKKTPRSVPSVAIASSTTPPIASSQPRPRTAKSSTNSSVAPVASRPTIRSVDRATGSADGSIL